MRALTYSLVLLFGIVNMARGQGKAIAELASLQSEYDAELKRDVFDPHTKAVAGLLAKYATSMTGEIEAAQRGNKMEDVVALKAEKAQADAGQLPPPVDEVATPKSVVKLRAAFHAGLARLEQERDRKWQPFRDQYAKKLAP
jgi:hypothetical protein